MSLWTVDLHAGSVSATVDGLPAASSREAVVAASGMLRSHLGWPVSRAIMGAAVEFAPARLWLAGVPALTIQEPSTST